MNANDCVTEIVRMQVFPNEHQPEGTSKLNGNYSPSTLTFQRNNNQGEWSITDLLSSMPESTQGSINVHVIIAPGADLKVAADESRSVMIAAGSGYRGDDRIQLTSPNTIHVIVSDVPAVSATQT